jgi:pimeloyl-ACP methyl ester carboxylesterase
MNGAAISTADPHPRRRIDVRDAQMAYIDRGAGDAIVFLHGNPTSSYLWRNVIPHVSGLGRVLAPDLIGMGRSSQAPAGTYRFVERILPASVVRPLSGEEMEVYRSPFRDAGESRRPTLTWPREIPIDGAPPDVAEIVDDYGKWLSASPIPKLFINAEPGSILVGPQREFCRGFHNQEEVTVEGNHFIQEDSPHEIGEALARFVRRLRAGA